MTFFTYTLTGSDAFGGVISINANDNASFVSVVPMASSSCSVEASGTFGNGTSAPIVPSTAVSLTAGQGANFQSSSTASPLDGIVIKWLSGNVNVIIGF